MNESSFGSGMGWVGLVQNFDCVTYLYNTAGLYRIPSPDETQYQYRDYYLMEDYPTLRFDSNTQWYNTSYNDHVNLHFKDENAFTYWCSANTYLMSYCTGMKFYYNDTYIGSIVPSDMFINQYLPNNSYNSYNSNNLNNSYNG